MIIVPKINLLSTRKSTYDRRSVLLLQSQVGTGIALVVYLIILGVVVITKVIFNGQLSATNESINHLKSQLANKSQLVNEYETVVKQSAIIESLITKRRESIQLWNQLQTLIPLGTELVQFQLAGDTVNVGVKAPHVVLANKVIDMIQNDLMTLGIRQTTVHLQRAPDASYTISFTVTLTSKAVQAKGGI